MSDADPLEAGPDGALGGRPPKVHVGDDDGDLRWEIRGRCHAVLAELDVRPAVDWDVCQVLLAGAVEAIEAAS